MFDVAMDLAVEERVELSALVHGRDVPAIVATRAQIVLWWTEGRRKKDIAMLAGVTRPTVDFWISRYAHEGTGGLLDRSRAAPREQVPARIRGRILALTRSSPPAESGLPHWSSRQMATFIACTEGVPVSPSYVAALWRANGLTPQRQGTFSRDPQFADKVADIVGLYLDPPGARSCSAWTKRPSFRPYRTQPLLPISVGAAEKRTHDYVRHGTTNLFAALNVTSGDVYGECHPTRAGASFLAFLKHAVAPHARMSMSCWPICRRTPHPMSRPGWRPTRRFTSTSPRSAHPGSIRSRPGSAP